MNQRKLERIVKFLRENHVSHLKTLEFEISLAPSDKPYVSPGPVLETAHYAVPPTGAAIPPVETTIPHHVNEVSKLLKLSDEELVDRIFPVEAAAGQQPAQGAD